jgi:hypothetical protein
MPMRGMCEEIGTHEKEVRRGVNRTELVWLGVRPSDNVFNFVFWKGVDLKGVDLTELGE